MKSTVETITPQRARDLLELNTDNYRAADENRVHRYALDMVHGRWLLTGDAVKVSREFKDGQRVLLDGQQRLLACIEADRSFETFVVYGLDPEAADVMDWGKKRTLANLLKHRGWVNTLALSGLINLSYRWENGLLFERTYPSPPDALVWLRQNPEAQTAANIAVGMHRKLVTPTSVMGAFTLRAQSYSPEDEVTFRQQVLTGAGLDEGNPTFALRRWCLEGAGKKFQGDTLYHFAVWIKAWNAFVLGRTMSQPGWRREGTHREPFPIMVDPRKNRS